MTGVPRAMVICAILAVVMVHIKEPLLLIEKSTEWSFTICPMPYNHK